MSDISGLTPDEILACGMLTAAMYDGVKTMKAKGFNVEFEQWFSDEGKYEKQVYITVEGIRIRVELHFPSEMADLTSDLVALRDELGGNP